MERQANYKPDPDPKQLRKGQIIVCRVLEGERLEVFRDREGRVCIQPVERGDVER